MPRSTDKTKRKAKSSPDSVVTDARRINPKTQAILFGRAAGRCERDGCNRYLLAHSLTGDSGNLAQVAHVIAFKRGGARGAEPLDRVYINDVSNLMLLCYECHRLVDVEKPSEYTKATLQKYKKAHEARIRHITEAKPDRKTTVLQLKSRIGGTAVDIPVGHVREAVSPRYPDGNDVLIDLTTIDEGDGFYPAARTTIRSRVKSLYERGMEVDGTHHVSLFALAPMPLLIYLGNQLSDKIPVDFYQRHRDTKNWIWKTSGTPVEYRFRCLRKGSDVTKVALLLSLSGTIQLADLPRKKIDKRFSVYEITLADQTPNPTFLKLPEELVAFTSIYLEAIGTFQRDHPGLREIHLFPAVPAPIAVLCGYNLLRKVHPTLRVYDNDKRTNGCKFIFEVNNNE